MVDFLLELNSEEIPARFLIDFGLANSAIDNLIKMFANIGVNISRHMIQYYYTPRRIAFIIQNLPDTLPEMVQEIRGPKYGSPEDVVEKFKQRYDSATISIADTAKGQFYMAKITTPPVALAKVLGASVADFIINFSWPKSMTWGDTKLRWVRPLRRIVAILDDKPLTGGLFLGFDDKPAGYTDDITDPRTLPYSNQSLGKLTPDGINDISVTTNNYKKELLNNGIMVDHHDRYGEMMKSIQQICTKNKIKFDEASCFSESLLLDQEINALIDYPAPFIGKIDDRFMYLPATIIRKVMAVHQKYLPVMDADNNIAPYFLGVANSHNANVAKLIVSGNERVLRARLSDAAFFWDNDLKKPLFDYNESLKNRTFHLGLQKYGLDTSVFGKIHRMHALVPVISPLINNADVNQIMRAVMLAKADLATGMVGEFPELQGQVGAFYAKEQGEDLPVVDAIRSQYALDNICKPVSVALAMIDRFDSLISFFAAGERSTGSKDPFALRRFAYGIINLMHDNSDIKLFNISKIFTDIKQINYPSVGVQFPDNIYDDVAHFIIDKFKSSIDNYKNISPTVVNNLIPNNHYDIDFIKVISTLDALNNFERLDVLNATATRLRGLCGQTASIVDIDLLHDPLEKQVFDLYQNINKSTGHNIEDTLHELLTICPTINNFLDNIRINDEHFGDNRRGLIAKLLELFVTIGL